VASSGVLPVGHLHEMLGVDGVQDMARIAVDDSLVLVVVAVDEVELGRVQHILDVDVVGAEGALAGLGRVGLAVDLAVGQVDLVRVVGLEVELALAGEALEAGLVVDVALDGADALQGVDLVGAAEALVLEVGVGLGRGDKRGRVADVAGAEQVGAE